MQKQPPSNHGEGDPEAAERFNAAERDFVKSDRGKRKVAEGAKVQPSEEAELAKAEQAGRSKAKDGNSSGTPRQ